MSSSKLEKKALNIIDAAYDEMRKHVSVMKPPEYNTLGPSRQR